jgi:uncharacterized protein YoxC
MPFELRDFQDLVRLLREHPDWREELRALLLTQELLTLPALVRELAKGQERLTETVAHLSERLDQLAETVAHLSERLDQLAETVAHLTERLDQLTETVAHLSERLDQLTETVAHLTERLDQLTETVARLAEGQQHLTEGQQRLAEGQQRLEVQMGEVRGWALEQRYRTRAAAYFGRFLRRVHPVDVGRLAEALRERVAEGELAEVLLADLILTGQLPTPAGPRAIWVVLEVSALVDRRDIERAQRRAAVLRQARYPAVAVAAGMEATAGARQAARDAGVALLLDGRIDRWQEALAVALAEGEEGARSP